jgi:hypothetical protein
LERALALTEGADDDPERVDLRRRLNEARQRAAASTPASDAADALRLERAGDLWTLRWAAAVVHVRHSRGMTMLEALVANPGQEILALDLDASGDAPRLGDAGEVIDAQAKEKYRARVEELRDAIESAEQLGDSARALRLHEERAAIARELGAAIGLGGRARRSKAPVERARINVQQRLRDAIRRVGEANVELGRHLDWAVRTGVYCSYDPDRRP